MEELSARLVAALSQKRAVPKALQGPGQELYMKAATAWMAEAMNNPARLMESQIAYWGRTLTHYIEAQQKLARGDFSPPADKVESDRRFSDPLWETHPWFNFVRQQYLINSSAISEAVKNLEGLDGRDRKRVEYFTQQIVDMMSPANFLSTNPQALTRAVETEGKSLVDGLENLVRDIEAGRGELLVTLSDTSAFELGRNIATTPGKVVFRNRLFELIQYAPTTDQVHTIPLVIFPPWINKFYILDLKEQNSLIRWIVSQGFTLFVVSWKNPDPSYADVGIGDYIEEGYLEALREVREICGTDKVNAIGYCIAGTTLALTLSLLRKRGDNPVNSATFFTALTDFSDQGEVGVFLDDDFIDAIEAEVDRHGILDRMYMARTFSYLRSNDLIYGPAIRSYMMGETPPAFDLLYWNGDGTNLPARMAKEYLRWLCQQDRFAKDGVDLLGERLTLADVDVPLCAVACETDHIAGWKQSYRGIQAMGSASKTFILSESGHIAGIVNPPSKKKYGHWTNGDWSGSPEDWQAAATFHEGSWWGRWGQWLAERSGDKIPARKIGGGKREPLADAPGTYVREIPAA
nr:class I poly(R)-hydroxyalkanoic acid synthase [Oceaniovalibus guishaninsula]